MKHNEFTKKLLKLEVGSTLTLKKRNGTNEGTFLRVPSGWVYRYSDRRGITSCFIPYTDEILYYNDDLHIKRCRNCNSANINLHHWTKRDIYFVQCDDCMAKSGSRKSRLDAIYMWNVQN